MIQIAATANDNILETLARMRLSYRIQALVNTKRKRDKLVIFEALKPRGAIENVCKQAGYAQCNSISI
jgi:hypothetical protein